MSTDNLVSEKSADPNAQNPTQPPAYQTEPPEGQYPPTSQYPPRAPDQYPPPGQYPPPDQKYPPTAQYPSQGQYPPPGQQYPPTVHYDQQQASVTVVTAQPAPVARRYATHQSATPDYLKLTIVSMVLCFFCGGVVGTVLLIPALYLSMTASNYNKSGDYSSAKKYGRASLYCNIGVYIFIILANIAWIIYIIVVTVQRNTPNIICAPGSRAPPCIGRG